MKIGDVEYQGDKTKAIFYYIADERVDFRQLIKLYAETFHIRIEMRQIGARQEAGRIGGIGPCGRELCCCTWISNFVSVTTNAARYQEISLNPQKLAGQCSKLKCCLNYELDCYIDAQKNFPPTNVAIETDKGTFNYLKADIFKGIYYYVKEGNQQGGMFSSKNIEVPILGIVENMSWFTPEELPDNKYYIFGKDGGKDLAKHLGIPFLGQIPIVMGIREGGDRGIPEASRDNTISGQKFMLRKE